MPSLPSIELPEPGPLPAGSRLLHRRNLFFSGRTTYLRSLATTLNPDLQAVKGTGSSTSTSHTSTYISPTAAITGAGGIGKTQLAVEFAYRYGRNFPGGAFWLSFADPDNVPTEIAACGRSDCLALHPQYDDLKVDQQVALVRRAWQENTPRLLIFDNCEEEHLLETWRPTTGGCRVLVTSRRDRWKATLDVTTRPLATLERSESVALLQQLMATRADETTLSDIANELGDFPLAVYLAGRYLREFRHETSPALYLANLRTEGSYNALAQHLTWLQELGEDETPTKHELDVARTFLRSYDRLLDNSPRSLWARELLAHAACFAPGLAIPWPLLRLSLKVDLQDAEMRHWLMTARKRLLDLGLVERAKVEGKNGDSEQAKQGDTHNLNNMQNQATTSTFTELDDSAIRLHRLVADFVMRQTSDIETVRAAVEETLINKASSSKKEEDLAPWLDWAGHLRYVTDNASIRRDERTAKLNSSLGYFLRRSGDHTGERLYLERALAIQEKIWGPAHPETAQGLHDLGIALHDLGDLDGEEPLVKRALIIREKVLGPDHPDTATSLNDIGALASIRGNLVEARKYYELALAIREKVLGPDHPDTAVSLNNLGFLLRRQAELVKGKLYLERALTIREKTFGPNHPITAVAYSNFGRMLQDLGKMGDAQPYFEHALSVREKTLGRDHPSTAISLNNLGRLLYDLGDYVGARMYLERALAIREKLLGPEHIKTAINLNDIGMLLKDMGNLVEAQPYLERALAIREKVLGPTNPFTADSLNNLGMLLKDMGNLVEARPYLERSLAIREQVLGPEHPETADSLHDLGSLQYALGERAEVRPYFERALAIWEKILGSEHPETARGLEWMGILTWEEGLSTEAHSYLQRAFVIYKESLGEDHPRTQRVQHLLEMFNNELTSKL
jgi:tetratricopeptide (TPR) repeat protein